ncbi:hypothetical protein [Winogradskyella thalassocola]|uniref:Uncharacterized protein n=1 Tax=Winogradskyella thalassocola TaxID=262004 RepID=A0A1G8K4T4_9FLAO|nr:hypothetical protein [Winogradskyella thalassocola]SDI38441.1 hypothetical protein SAMN04489796_11070 [Winogradskyella thalassocola]
MIKNISILLVLLLTTISYGQKITLLQNTNPKAKELRHGLNATMDSLVLECDSKIQKVEIFNEDYEQIVIVEANKTRISLKDIPIGNFIIETKLAEKIIVLDLAKHKDFYNISNSNTSRNTEHIIEGKGMMLDEELNVIKSSPNKSIAFLLTRGGTKNHTTKNQKYFWIEAQINNDSGSSKTMRLVDQKSVETMILRHKLETNSDSGRLNKLTVWEVYKKSEFMENQVSNPDFVYSATTDLFNPTPYYSTTNNLQSL